MREVSKNTIKAFLAGKACKVGNTSVTCTTGYCLLRLHGNLIAIRKIETGEIRVSDAGWQTPTTKERLNSLFSLLGVGVRVFQQCGVWKLQSESGCTEWGYVTHIAQYSGGIVNRFVA